MEINLKQPELFNAIKQYLQSQGFKLRGKEVSIVISSGRAPSGAYANISITEIEIPGFDQDSDDAPVIEMVNQEINQLVAEEQADSDPEPATADATLVPGIETIKPESLVSVGVHHGEVITLTAEQLGIAGQTEPLTDAAFTTIKEPSLEEPEESGLFDTPLVHEPEQAKPAVTPSPSSLFDE